MKECGSNGALRDARLLYQTLFEQSPDGILLIDTEGAILEFNEAAHQQLGYSREEFSKLKIADVDPIQNAEDIKASITTALEKGHAELDVKHITKSGEVRDVRVITKTIKLSGRVMFHTILRDVTAQKRSLDSLRGSEELLRTIVDTEPECVKLISRDGSLITMNPAGLAMIEADSLDLVKGKPVHNLIAPEYRDAFVKLTEDVFSGKSSILEFRITGLKGRQLWLETHAVPLRNGADEIVALLGITRDITERKDAENELRKSEEFIRSVLDTVDEGFIVIDRDFRILTVNRAYCSQTGMSCKEIIGRNCYAVSHKSLRPCYEEGEECAVKQAFETGHPHVALHRHLDRVGAFMYVETKAFPLKDKSGQVTSVIETIVNITEKHLLEEERLKTQKLESIGTLAGGIAHNFNNLLQGIFGHISMAKMFVDQKERALTMLEQAENALYQSVSLTAQLLTFSKGGKPVKKRTALPPVIRNAANFALSGSRSICRFDFEPELRHVEADSGQLGQVIQNIVLNADQAMSEGGEIVISARNVFKAGRGHPNLPEGNYVEISIQDGGIGIPEKYRQKIFDPYFTTKEKGSGLGLATSYSIIRNHGGLIDVVSEQGRGATFRIYLPAPAGKEEDKGFHSAVSTVRKGKILVMDDDDLVRSLAGALVEILGHQVALAENGETAIAKYHAAMKAGEPFDIVILDLTVRGGMGGEDTLEQLLLIDSGVKAIVSSGYSDNSVVADYELYGFRARLIKPYTLDALRDSLNSILGPVRDMMSA